MDRAFPCEGKGRWFKSNLGHMKWKYEHIVQPPKVGEFFYFVDKVAVGPCRARVTHLNFLVKYGWVILVEGKKYPYEWDDWRDKQNEIKKVFRPL